MFEKESELIESLSKYSIEIGVISEDTGRKETVSYGITNAELMQIHENGSHIKKAQYMSANGTATVYIEFTDEGKDILKDLTKSRKIMLKCKHLD